MTLSVRHWQLLCEPLLCCAHSLPFLLQVYSGADDIWESRKFQMGYCGMGHCPHKARPLPAGEDIVVESQPGFGKKYTPLSWNTEFSGADALDLQVWKPRPWVAVTQPRPRAESAATLSSAPLGGQQMLAECPCSEYLIWIHCKASDIEEFLRKLCVGQCFQQCCCLINFFLIVKVISIERSWIIEESYI